jgi:D-alanyl-D-alanine carboxypeptidase
VVLQEIPEGNFFGKIIDVAGFQIFHPAARDGQVDVFIPPQRSAIAVAEPGINFQLDGKTIDQRPLVVLQEIPEGNFFGKIIDYIRSWLSDLSSGRAGWSGRRLYPPPAKRDRCRRTRQNQVVGTINFQLDGKTIDQRPLVVLQEIPEGNFFSFIRPRGMVR